MPHVTSCVPYVILPSPQLTPLTGQNGDSSGKGAISSSVEARSPMLPQTFRQRQVGVVCAVTRGAGGDCGELMGKVL